MLKIALAVQLIMTVDPRVTAPSPLLSEKIEARVGQEIITSSDLQVMTQALGGLFKDESPALIKQKALETLIDRALMRVYLKNFGIEITDRELDQRIATIKAGNGVHTNEEFKALLAGQGLTFDQFKDQIRAQLENMQFMNVMRRQSNRTVEDKDLKEYWQNHKQDFAQSQEVELQECVLLPTSPAERAQKTAARFKANPKSFDECVKNYSQSPSKEAGGRIGWFQSGLLREDVEATVFDLKKGQVASFEMSGGAIQLLKVVGLRNKGPQSFESIKDKIRERLESEIIQKEIQRTLADLRNKTFIQI